MKTLGTIVAAAGVALLMSIGGAGAQTAGGSGTGDAAAKDRPSTVGLSNPGAQPRMGSMRMGKRKMMRHRMRHHRRHRMM